MQLVKFTNSLKPITLAVGLLGAAHVYLYSDIDSFSGILTNATNNKVAEYIKSTDRSDITLIQNRFKFQQHLSSWQQNTLFLSSTKAIIENSDFKAIVSMGYSVVPLIVEELEIKPSTLVWALNQIFNKKISNNPNTTITEACKLWVKELK